MHKLGSVYALSGASEVSLEALAREVSGPCFFNLIPTRSREIMESLIERARDAGFGALIVTVDFPTHSNRERDRRSGFGFPPSLSLAGWLSVASRPRWWLDKFGYELQFANYTEYLSSPERDLEWLFNEFQYPKLDWGTMSWIAKTWRGPLAIKGVLSADDARRCVDAGVSSIIVSNQGARHFDTSPAPFNVLAEICDAVGEQVEVTLDGGIRRGTDALKAIAIGAKAVTIARPFAYGLAAAGREGVVRALDILRSEIQRDMCFLGAARLADLTRADLRTRNGFNLTGQTSDYRGDWYSRKLEGGDGVDRDAKTIGGACVARYATKAAESLCTLPIVIAAAAAITPARPRRPSWCSNKTV